MSTSKTITVCSDLHLFAKWSTAHQKMQRLKDAMAQSDIVVFNGDIFEFKWMALPSVAETLLVAKAWLAMLAQTHPNTQFHFIQGNHDHHHEFLDHLGELSIAHANFTHHGDYLKIGRCLFLHGDIPLRGHVNDYRTKFSKKIKKPSPWKGKVYHMALKTQVHKLIIGAQPTWYNARKIVRHLRNTAPEDFNHCTDIYFGHTHRPCENFAHQGKRFHNTGASIHGTTWNLLTFDLPA